MIKSIINPWDWQDNFGYAQAVEVKNASGTLYCSGQAAMDSTGKPVEGNMEEQIAVSLTNLEAVIQKAGYQTADIIRLNFYTVSVPDFFAGYGTVVSWMEQHRCRPSSTLVEVGALAFPVLQVELEATVVR